MGQASRVVVGGRFALLTLAAVLISASEVPAQTGGDDAALVRGASNRLIGRLSSSADAETYRLLEERAGGLHRLVKEDPVAALAEAFSEPVLARLRAAFPEAQSRGLESRIDGLEGEVEALFVDGADLRTCESRILLNVGASEALEVHFAGSRPEGLMSGDRLRVSGIRVEDRLAAEGGTVVAPVAAFSSCSTMGDQRTVVLLVTFPGVTPPIEVTPASVQEIFFASSGRSVDGYWRETSDGQASASGDVFGWYTLPQNYVCDDSSAIRTAAIAAADADVNFQQYTRVFIVFPTTNCNWAGLGTLGCPTLSSPGDGSFRASTSWLVAAYMRTRDQGVKLVAHEGGHNLGLHHASSRDFGVEALGALGAAGTLSEYGDIFSAMGSLNLGHYAAPHMVNLLGWLGGSSVLTVETPGTFVLSPAESGAGLRALKIRRGTGNDAWLWAEFRQPIGIYDSTLPSQVFSGALLHYADSSTGTHTHLLDFTPATSSWNDPALVGSWADPYSNLSLSVLGAGPAGLTLGVDFSGTIPCVEGSPTVSLSPPNPSAPAGNALSYTVTVTNGDSGGCPAKSFALSCVPPSGWAYAFGSPSLAIAPGASASTSLTLTIPAGQAPAVYPLSVSATDGILSGSASANATVLPPPAALSIALAIPSSIYSKGSTVSMAATVTQGGNKVAGANVVFTLTKSSGATVVQSKTTSNKGIASRTYRIKSNDPSGTYTVGASVTYGGQTATSALIPFTVQ
ncbi:MAG: NEW3 domain-containing protein [Planctomycetes bacterium]|nr:NEW3 domain-containing protein [Planctomycetota bacterium]